MNAEHLKRIDEGREQILSAIEEIDEALRALDALNGVIQKATECCGPRTAPILADKVRQFGHVQRGLEAVIRCARCQRQPRANYARSALSVEGRKSPHSGRRKASRALWAARDRSEGSFESENRRSGRS